MNRSPSHRRFLAIGFMIAVGAVIALASRFSRAATIAAAPIAHAFVTDSAGHHHAPLDEVLGGTAAPDVTFTFDDATPKQTILGFGAALTEGSCATLGRLAPADRTALLDEFFNPDKSNFSIGRLCVGASDYSTELYSYDEGEPDPTLSRFSIDHDRTAVLPVLQQARKINPDLYLFASPWSPPGWMKYGGSMCGGSIKPHLLGVYAQYIVRYLQAYRDAGVPINAMTIQNEIDADQDGRMPACAWPAETEVRYLVNHLCPLLKTSQFNTPIWMLDHNYDLVGRVLDQLAKPKVRPLISAIAWHGYEGKAEAIDVIRQKYPDLPAHWTEGGDSIGSKHLADGWAHWAGTFDEILNNGASSITTWNLALDEQGRPNIGPFRCAGLVTIDSKTKAVTRNGIYWALTHFAKAMPRGSQVLPMKATALEHVHAAAARRADGSVAVVVSNVGPVARIRIDVGRRSQSFNATENSVTTIILP